MQQAVDSLNSTASRIAKNGFPQAGSTPAGSTPANATGGDTVSLSSDMVSLMTARNSFDANAKAAEVTDQTTRYALDMFA
jgi:hypothetical protein